MRIAILPIGYPLGRFGPVGPWLFANRGEPEQIGPALPRYLRHVKRRPCRRQALARAGGNKTRAAELLGVHADAAHADDRQLAGQVGQVVQLGDQEVGQQIVQRHWNTPFRQAYTYATRNRAINTIISTSPMIPSFSKTMAQG